MENISENLFSDAVPEYSRRLEVNPLVFKLTKIASGFGEIPKENRASINKIAEILLQGSNNKVIKSFPRSYKQIIEKIKICFDFAKSHPEEDLEMVKNYHAMHHEEFL